MGKIWKKHQKVLLTIFLLPLIIGCKQQKNHSSLSSLTSSLVSSSSQVSSSKVSEEISSSVTDEISFSTSSIKENKYRILLIAGHGQNDSGATYQNRKESEYNQEFVNLLVEELNKFEHQIEIILEPYSMKASDEANLISSLNIDFALSVHFNAGGGTGSEMIVPFYEDEFSFVYNFFEELEQNNFPIRQTSIYSKSTAIKLQRNKNDKSYSHTDSFAVIRAGAKKKIPSYILEVEFIDNIAQMNKYDQRKNIYISLLAKHILNYFK